MYFNRKITIRLALLLTLISFVSCQKEEFDIQNLEGNRIVCMGHGGMGIGYTYPMNTFESIQNCLLLGMDGCEIDVQLTKDNVLVAYHDSDLESSTTIKGMINDLTWEEIKGAKYQKTLYLNYAICSLDDLFDNLESIHSFKFTFDCKLYCSSGKDNSYYDAYITALISLLEKYQMEDNVYIESQDTVFLKKVKALKPDLKLFIYPSSFNTGLSIAKELNLYGITISTRDVTKAQIAEAHQYQKRVAIWNIHSKSDTKEAIDKNPDIIQTDKVSMLIRLLKK